MRRLVLLLAAAALTPEGATVPEPGRIVDLSKEGLDVACADGSVLRIGRVQPESRGPMTAFDFANGSKLRPGTQFAP